MCRFEAKRPRVGTSLVVCCSALPSFITHVPFPLAPTLNQSLPHAEKTGIARVREAIEANDWAQVGSDLGSEFGDFEAALESDEDLAEDPSSANDISLDPESLDFGFDKEDFTGLKRAIWNAGHDGEGDLVNGETSRREPSTDEASDDKLDDQEVQKLESMMHKLQAVRDMSAGLPEDQRRRMAAKAVKEVMKDI